MPAFPTGAPSFPNVSAGGGGPSGASAGTTMGGAGLNGANWAVNFGGQNAVGTASAPQQVGFVPGSFGMPSYVTAPGGIAAPSGGVVTPMQLLLIGAAAFLLLRRG